MTELTAHRGRFPVLKERSYFDTQSLGPFPEDALADLEAYRSTLFLRNRGIEQWVVTMFEVTGLLERVLGATPGSVALRDSATAAQAAIAAAVEPRGERKKILVAPWLDFRSTRFLWLTQERRGFTIAELGREGDPQLAAEDILAALDETVAIVALPLVSPRTGARLPIERITARAREVGALTVIDAYQAIGIVPVDVQTLGADVLVGGTHKWLCGVSFGLAFLWVSPTIVDTLPVVYPGWIGSRSLLGLEQCFEPADGTARFQQGTPAIEPIYTARAGLRWILEVGVDALRKRSLVLTERMLHRAIERGLRSRNPLDPAERGGVLVFDVPDPARIVAELAAQAIDVDARPDAGLRVGPFPCLDEAECDRAIDAIAASVANATP